MNAFRNLDCNGAVAVASYQEAIRNWFLVAVFTSKHGLEVPSTHRTRQRGNVTVHSHLNINVNDLGVCSTVSVACNDLNVPITHRVSRNGCRTGFGQAQMSRAWVDFKVGRSANRRVRTSAQGEVDIALWVVNVAGTGGQQVHAIGLTLLSRCGVGRNSQHGLIIGTADFNDHILGFSSTQAIRHRHLERFSVLFAPGELLHHR